MEFLQSRASFDYFTKKYIFLELPWKDVLLSPYKKQIELVDTIDKDDNGSIAYWNLLSSEGMRISYGVYIFHVDVPGVGEKIGRFGVIK